MNYHDIDLVSEYDVLSFSEFKRLESDKDNEPHVIDAYVQLKWDELINRIFENSAMSKIQELEIRLYNFRILKRIKSNSEPSKITNKCHKCGEVKAITEFTSLRSACHECNRSRYLESKKEKELFLSKMKLFKAEYANEIIIVCAESKPKAKRLIGREGLKSIEVVSIDKSEIIFSHKK